jgi:5-formyltetrahydrofolate cyclo-ligase
LPPMTDLLQAKTTLRTEIRAQLQGLSLAHRTQRSAELCARLREQKIWRQAKAVLLFAPLPDEPDIWPLLQEAMDEKKIVGLPCFESKANSYVARRVTDPARDLVAGKFGIREVAELSPELELNQLDLVLVPGVAFDARGGRLGRGKGFYDRLLACVRGTKCGVAFDEQFVETVPVGPQDIPLNCILTPTRWIET